MGFAACAVVIISPGSALVAWVAILGTSLWWPLAGFAWLGTVVWLILDPLIGVACL